MNILDGGIAKILSWKQGGIFDCCSEIQRVLYFMRKTGRHPDFTKF